MATVPLNGVHVPDVEVGGELQSAIGAHIRCHPLLWFATVDETNLNPNVPFLITKLGLTLLAVALSLINL